MAEKTIHEKINQVIREHKNETGECVTAVEAQWSVTMAGAATLVRTEVKTEKVGP